MNPHTSTRHRRRRRSPAEQMYWDRLTPTERLAFTLGYVVGQGIDFPTPAQIGALRIQLGVGRPVARTADGRRFSYDLAMVAKIARDAIASGRSATQAVYEQIEHCASPKAAGVAISRARKAGHHIPYTRQPGGST